MACLDGRGDARTNAAYMDGSGDSPTSYNPTLIDMSDPIQAPSDVKPSNFIKIYRTAEISHHCWVIDPDMNILHSFAPSNVLPQNQDGSGESKPESVISTPNLDIRSSGGKVMGAVFVLPTLACLVGYLAATDKVYVRLRAEANLALLYVYDSVSKNKFISKILEICRHTPIPRTNTPGPHRLPLHIHLSSGSSPCIASIPTSFCGPVRIKAAETVFYSSSIQAQQTPFSEEDGLHLSFVGDFDPSAWTGWDSWTGDILDIQSSNGGVFVFSTRDNESDRVNELEKFGVIIDL